jgi:hypothetical protein
LEYKEFYIWAYERRPGKWRAGIQRAAGTTGVKKSAVYTDSDARTAAEALTMAMVAIDRTSFLPRTKKGTERFWRIQRRTSEHR